MSLRADIRDAVKRVRAARFIGPYTVFAEASRFRAMGVRVPQKFRDDDVLRATVAAGRVTVLESAGEAFFDLDDEGA